MRGAICVESIETLKRDLRNNFYDNNGCDAENIKTSKFRLPLALLFIRPPFDIEIVKNTFDYWHYATGTAIDIVLPGWSTDREFEAIHFSKFEKELIEGTKWQMLPSPNILLLDYIYNESNHEVELDFSKCIVLPAEEMIAKKRITSLDALLTEIIGQATKQQRNSGSADTFSISDGIAISIVSNNVLDWLQSKGFLSAAIDIYKGFKPYAVCDLRKKPNKTN